RVVAWVLVQIANFGASTPGFSMTGTSRSWSPRANARHSPSGVWQAMAHQHGAGSCCLASPGTTIKSFRYDPPPGPVPVRHDRIVRMNGRQLLLIDYLREENRVLREQLSEK